METMNFKSYCKFCGEKKLAWVELTVQGAKKWVLFKTHTEKHLCLSSAKKAEVKADETVKKPTPKQLAFKKSLQKKMEKQLDEEATNVLNKIEKSKGIDTPPDVNDFVSHSKTVNPCKEVGEKVKLYSATKLYQPVSASSAGSTYYVVAMWDGLNMACRIKTYAGYHTVSLRIEGLNYEKWKNLDMLSKFNHQNGYASNHYNATNLIDARAVIYAFIGMINKTPLTPMPNLNKILK